MSNLLRRLRKLEAQLTDRNGLVPHTKPWRDYWSPRIEGLMTGEVVDQKIPFEVIDTLTHADESALSRTRQPLTMRIIRRRLSNLERLFASPIESETYWDGSATEIATDNGG